MQREPFHARKGYDLTTATRINGELIGMTEWSSARYSFAEMIAHASRGTEVRPGDVFGSGTCGRGCLAELWGRRGIDAHAPLRADGTMTVEIEQLSSITSHIVDYPAR